MALSNPDSKSCDSNNGNWVSHWRSTPRHVVVTVGYRTGWLILGTQMTWKYPKTQKTQPQERKLSQQSVWFKSPDENVSWTKCLCVCWMKSGGEKAVFLWRELYVWGFLYQFKRIQRNRGGQEILLNGKAAWLCHCASMFFKKGGRKRYREGNKERERGRGAHLWTLQAERA